MLPDKIFLESTFFDKFLWVQKYDAPRLTHILVFKSLFTFDRNGIQTVKPLVWLLLKSPNPICAIKVSKPFHDIILNLWTHSNAENRMLLCSVILELWVYFFKLPLQPFVSLLIPSHPSHVSSYNLGRLFPVPDTWRLLGALTFWQHSHYFSDTSLIIHHTLDLVKFWSLTMTEYLRL